MEKAVAAPEPSIKSLLEGPHVHRNLSTPQLVEAALRAARRSWPPTARWWR